MGMRRPQDPLDQHARAVADMRPHLLDRLGRQAEPLQHTVCRSGQIGPGIDQGPVKIENQVLKTGHENRAGWIFAVLFEASDDPPPYSLAPIPSSEGWPKAGVGLDRAQPFSASSTANEVPQPQVRTALGLTNRKPAPLSPS